MKTLKTLNDLTPAQLIERAGTEHVTETPFGYIGRLTIKDVYVDFDMTRGPSVGKVKVMSIDDDHGKVLSWIAFDDDRQIGTYQADQVFLSEIDALWGRMRRLDAEQAELNTKVVATVRRIRELEQGIQ